MPDSPLRLDDMIRSERYFTATLLPALLFHDHLAGLSTFLRRLEDFTHSERDRDGQLRPVTVPLDPGEAPEVITEFHIARDLGYYGVGNGDNPLPQLPADEAAESAPERRDAPDVVLVLERTLVVIEAKFFVRYQVPALNAQLASQRKQVRLILDARPEIEAYRHIALLPASEQVDADGVLTWSNVSELAEEILGPDHYVTARLETAIERFESSAGVPGARNWDGREGLRRALELCAQRGDAIKIGVSGGLSALRAMSPEAVSKRRWKWRDQEWRPRPIGSPGISSRSRWIRSSRPPRGNSVMLALTHREDDAVHATTMGWRLFRKY